MGWGFQQEFTSCILTEINSRNIKLCLDVVLVYVIIPFLLSSCAAGENPGTTSATSDLCFPPDWLEHASSRNSTQQLGTQPFTLQPYLSSVRANAQAR